MTGKGEHNLFWINTYISSRISSKGGFISLLFLESRASKWSKPEVSSFSSYGVKGPIFVTLLRPPIYLPLTISLKIRV